MTSRAHDRPFWALTATLLLCCLARPVRSHAADTLDPKTWIDALEAAKPASEGWTVENLRVELGVAHLDIVKATLVPVVGPEPTAQELLVLGEAHFALATSSPVEAYQLELFTGGRELDERLDRAVLVVADDAAMGRLLERPGRHALDAETLAAAQALFASWRHSREWKRGQVASALLEDAARDPVARGHFVAWCHSPKLGAFLYSVDPFDVEQVTVRQFVEADLGDDDADSERRRIARDREEGRSLTVDVEDYGFWDTWFSDSMRHADGSRAPGAESFEPKHYDLNVTVAEYQGKVDAEARIALAVRVAGATAMHLRLNPDLVVSAVTDRSGRTLRSYRDTWNLTVLLDTPASAGDELLVAVRYAGVLFREDSHGLSHKRDTQTWYPHAGTIDRATYRATFDVPAPMAVLASGTTVSETAEAGRRRQTRELTTPTAFFGFETGHYDVVKRTVGHVALEVGFLTDIPWSMGADRSAVISVISDALAVYEDVFGPYPLDTLTVATSLQSFSQGFNGFVTLAQPIVTDVASKTPRGVEEARIIAHEVAHQWWGNRVGWTSYRDQWLSEALANYSAAVWKHRRPGSKPETRVASALLDLRGRQDLLETDTPIGRPIDAIGPVTLGYRLNSSHVSAYQEVVYQKGAMVFASLADQLGEEPFLAMLKEIAQRVANRTIDTETFVQALAKMSGRSLNGFADAFIYGVGYPEIHYRHEIAGSGTEWEVRGQIEQVPRGFRRDHLERIGVNGFDVVPVFRAYQNVESATAVIGAFVETGESQESKDMASQEARMEGLSATRLRGYRAQVVAHGEMTPISIRVKEQPARFRLDPNGFLPAPIWDETLEVKRGLDRKASSLMSCGRVEEALALYRQELETRLAVPPEEAKDVHRGNLAWWNQRQDGRIHLALAAIALDGGRVEDAEKELSAKDVAIAADAEPATSVTRKILRARLALHEGDAKSAYDLLSDVLALNIRQSQSESIGDAYRRRKFEDLWWGAGGDYLLLAAAAHATGHESVCVAATREAVRRGADSAMMDEIHGIVPPRP